MKRSKIQAKKGTRCHTYTQSLHNSEQAPGRVSCIDKSLQSIYFAHSYHSLYHASYHYYNNYHFIIIHHDIYRAKLFLIKIPKWTQIILTICCTYFFFKVTCISVYDNFMAMTRNKHAFLNKYRPQKLRIYTNCAVFISNKLRKISLVINHVL